MIDIQPRRYNEMIRAGSSILGQGGLALLAAALARWSTSGAGWVVLLWFVAAMKFLWLSLRIFELLQVED